MNTLPALYTIVAEFREQAEQLADMDLDEATLKDTLESIKWPVEEKARAVAAVIGNMGAANDMLAEFVKRKQEQLKASKAREESLRDYLLSNMLACEISEIKANDGSLTIKVCKNPVSVVIDDADAVPDEFKHHVPPPPPVPDKVLIKKALQAGEIVAGAHLDDSKFRVSIK